MDKGKVAPSMMCADFTRLRETLDIFEKNKVEYLHIDVMDGHFVPNFTLSDCIMRQVRSLTDIPFDYHFMVENPQDKLDWFDIRSGDMVSVHFESTPHIQRCISKIREKGALAGVALNPATPLCSIEYLLPDIDFVLIMTVNPGFAGQKIVPQTLQKIKDARSFLNDRGYGDVQIETDGSVSFEIGKIMRENGADIFVAGTSSIFSKNGTLNDNLIKLRECIK